MQLTKAERCCTKKEVNTARMTNYSTALSMCHMWLRWMKNWWWSTSEKPRSKERRLLFLSIAYCC